MDKINIEPKRIWIPFTAALALLGGVYWIGYSVATIRSDINSVNMRITNIEDIVKDSKAGLGEIMKIVNDHEQRITRLEARTDK